VSSEIPLIRPDGERLAEAWRGEPEARGRRTTAASTQAGNRTAAAKTTALAIASEVENGSRLNPC
jgi:hypothetical protein